MYKGKGTFYLLGGENVFRGSFDACDPLGTGLGNGLSQQPILEYFLARYCLIRCLLATVSQKNTLMYFNAVICQAMFLIHGVIPCTYITHKILYQCLSDTEILYCSFLTIIMQAWNIFPAGLFAKYKLKKTSFHLQTYLLTISSDWLTWIKIILLFLLTAFWNVFPPFSWVASSLPAQCHICFYVFT